MPAAPKPEKRRKRNPASEWAKEKAAHLKENPVCVRPETPDVVHCSRNVQVHHISPRGMGGSREKLPLVTLCSNHHEYVERNRAWAKSVGLLIRR